MEMLKYDTVLCTNANKLDIEKMQEIGRKNGQECPMSRHRDKQR
jgi:general stress protein YciG